MRHKFYLSVFSIMLLMASSLLSSNSLAANSRDFVQGSYAQITEAHKGHSFFVSLWSIDCPPCREELPEIADYFSRHPEISLVLISTDGKALSEEVERILQQNGLADAESWIFLNRLLSDCATKWIAPGMANFREVIFTHRDNLDKKLVAVLISSKEMIKFDTGKLTVFITAIQLLIYIFKGGFMHTNTDAILTT